MRYSSVRADQLTRGNVLAHHPLTPAESSTLDTCTEVPREDLATRELSYADWGVGSVTLVFMDGRRVRYPRDRMVFIVVSD